MIEIDGKAYGAYITVEQVDSYVEDSFYSVDWHDLRDNDKARAVVMASRWMDTHGWQGDTVTAMDLAVLVAVNPEYATATDITRLRSRSIRDLFNDSEPFPAFTVSRRGQLTLIGPDWDMVVRPVHFMRNAKRA